MEMQSINTSWSVISSAADLFLQQTCQVEVIKLVLSLNHEADRIHARNTHGIWKYIVLKEHFYIKLKPSLHFTT